MQIFLYKLLINYRSYSTFKKKPKKPKKNLKPNFDLFFKK